MPTIPLGYAQATMFYTGVSLPFGAATTLGLDVQGFSGTADEAADAVYLAWTQVVQGLAGTTRMATLSVKYGPTSTGVVGTASGEAISAANEAAAPNTCYLVSKSTALGGRQGRGRLFLPGVNEAGVSGAGIVAGTIVTDVGTRLSEAFADLIAADLPPVLLHDDGLAPTPLLGFNMSAKVATQRKRLRR